MDKPKNSYLPVPIPRGEPGSHERKEYQKFVKARYYKTKTATTSAVIGVIAKCQDCEWETQDYLKGQRSAWYHAWSKKHRVISEVTKVVEIQGKAAVE